ncbi:unnamed protein product [Durusdinium trenchii]|uniref:HotDog ACOT-type domain-containing protein n=1 Tax=Durusdinium trenchii TaxID=1381693 RepID=A0ABP0S403_9DINO
MNLQHVLFVLLRVQTPASFEIVLNKTDYSPKEQCFFCKKNASAASATSAAAHLPVAPCSTRRPPPLVAASSPPKHVASWPLHQQRAMRALLGRPWRLSAASRALRPQMHALRCFSGEDMAALHKSPIVQLLWKERANSARVTAGAKPQEKILTKTPHCSRVEVQYNFKDDPLLKEQYQNFNGLMQFSKLFEDLDALAGNVAFKHCDDDDPETRMPQLVTASVDRIRLQPGTAISLDKNYTMTGQVSWVGSSSLVIHMQLTTEDAKDVLKANFTFVARDVTTGKSCKINRLQPESEEEKRLFQAADDKITAMKAARKAGKRGSTHELDANSAAMARELLDQGRLLQDMPGLAVGDAVLISQTRRETMIICQPQQRNTAGRMFGGYLMRCAYRCAFPTAYMFAGSFPHFVEVDEVTFLQPVEVGDICEFSGQVMITYTKVRPVVHVEVTASVLKPDLKSSMITNVFNFVFELRPKPGQALPVVKRVFPNAEAGAQRVVQIMERHDFH